MRRLLLWMAENPWLRRNVPRLGFTRRAVLRFMPGEDADAALQAAMKFKKERISAVLTQLGEDITRIEEADDVEAHYLELLDRIATGHLDADISVKLTQLGLDLDGERAFGHVGRLAQRAATIGRTVWIDMEGSAYTERTVALYERSSSSTRTPACACRHTCVVLLPTFSDCCRWSPPSASSRAHTPSRR